MAKDFSLFGQVMAICSFLIFTRAGFWLISFNLYIIIYHSFMHFFNLLSKIFKPSYLYKEFIHTRTCILKHNLLVWSVGYNNLFKIINVLCPRNFLLISVLPANVAYLWTQPSLDTLLITTKNNNAGKLGGC